jgi:HPt (histidine-containing phosphotransfer) domain-containing protein
MVPPHPADTVFDPVRLAELADLDDDGETVRVVMKTFCDTSPAQLELLLDACQKADPEAVARIAHRMKGSARTIGARALGDACELMERAPEHAQRWTEHLKAAHRATIQAATALIADK